MSPHEAIAVAVRLFAVWLAAYALRTASAIIFGGAATIYSRPVDARGLIAAGIIGILTLSVALFLWFFPLTVAKKLLSPPATTAPTKTPDSWLAMGCALIGLWLLASAIPSIVRDALYFYSSFPEHDDLVEFKRWLAYRCVEVMIALWLIFGSTGFVKLFWWVRNAGTGKAV
jgi:hypothetical protein